MQGSEIFSKFSHAQNGFFNSSPLFVGSKRLIFRDKRSRLTEGVNDDDEKNAKPAISEAKRCGILGDFLAKNILRLPTHVYYKVTNIKYFLQHNIYIYIWYAYSISCTPLYTHKVHTTVVDFLQPIAQKAKKVGLVKRFQHSWFRAGRGWNNGVVSSVTNWFLQLHSRCPSQKWLIPLKLTIFNRVRESSNGQWWFAILVLWKSIYYQLQIDLGKRQPASHNIRWETYMTSMAQQNTLCKNWEINW